MKQHTYATIDVKKRSNKNKTTLKTLQKFFKKTFKNVFYIYGRNYDPVTALRQAVACMRG